MLQRASASVRHYLRVRHCLKEVSPLVKAGDWRNAYETLAIENRKSANATLERTMIDILLQARVMEAGTVEVASPGDSPLLFKGSPVCGVVPEVSANELTASKLQDAIQNHGYLLVRGLRRRRTPPSCALRSTMRCTPAWQWRHRSHPPLPKVLGITSRPIFRARISATRR